MQFFHFTFSILLERKLTFQPMRLITKEQQEEAGRYAMKGFAIGAAQWGCVGIFATTLASVFVPGFKKTPIQYKVDNIHYMLAARTIHLTPSSFSVLYLHGLCVRWWCPSF
jgi:hypothetical protein